MVTDFQNFLINLFTYNNVTKNIFGRILMNYFPLPLSPKSLTDAYQVRNGKKKEICLFQFPKYVLFESLNYLN